MTGKKLTRFAFILAGLLYPVSAAFASGDPMIDGARECTRYLPRFEREYGIPLHLLSAISSTESGRWHDGLKIALPWPWTINAEGKAYYLDSKEEAIATARKLKAQGVKSMDIGCMQVNLYHHPEAFRSIEDAFEPEKNIAYAASFLRNLYQEGGSWRKAAADYHSKTPSLGSQYVGLVYDKWYTIIDKLRLARTVVSSAEAMRPPAATSTQTAVYNIPSKPASAQPAIKAAATLGEQTGKKLPEQAPVRMKIIKVADNKPKRENGLIVIRPASASPATAPAAKQDAIMNVAYASSAAGAGTHATPAHTPATSSAAKGPRFIFTD